MSQAPATGSVEHRLAGTDDIPVGEGRAYAVGGRQVAVFRLRDGGWRATDAVCPHAGGPLADGLTDGCVVVCPLHANAFELATGRSTTGESPIEVYPVRVADGELVVELPG